MLSIFIQGFLMQASLILALGAQNIFVLNSGLRKQRHFLVAIVSTVCDALLIFVGVLGVATLFVRYPVLKIGLGIVGVVFLFMYGFLKIKDSMNVHSISQYSESSSTLLKTVLITLGFSLLNPHVYLDTIVLLGGYSTQFSTLNERFYFGAGASIFSLIWFFGLASLASLISGILSHPKAMQTVSLISGCILILLAIKLGNDVLGWIVKN